MNAPSTRTASQASDRVVNVLILGTVLVVMARSMSMPFLAIYLHRHMHLEAATIGLLIGGGALAGTFAGFFGGHLSDVYGRRKVLVGCLLVSCAAFAWLRFADSAIEVFFINMAISLAGAFYEPVSKATIGDHLPPQRRLVAFARRYVAVNIGFACGPLIGASLSLLDNAKAFAVAGAVYLVYAGFVFAAMRAPADTHAQDSTHAARTAPGLGAKLKVLAADHPLLLFTLGSMLAISVHGEMSVTFSQYLTATFSDGVRMFAWLMSANAITVVVSQPFISRLSTRMGPMPSVTAGALLLSIGAIGFAHAGGLSVLLASMIVFTWGEVLLVPAEYAILDGITPESMRGTYYGMHSLSNAGNLLGPWLGGVVLERWGGVALFYAMALVAIISLMFFFAGMRARDPVALRESEHLT